ncbi:hypothetical protein JO972_05695 [Verrucomicrobiaceae bacterium 5K15]|uniref:Uncharacterized protein n=1 Tax=Oceaniferula flava TaxID=2800421 RepID=A0AAE2SDB3_9BACT|nr:hypothetical protein [Oceaniferula flavus]MBK1854440.1 hypothetical protein [Oceaniferula flavus]MBM1135746.1 hypothetical protein [Oceaniferula flavus]
MQLYRLTLATIFQRKVWIVALLSVLLLPVILPYLTPYESNPTLVQPARAQAAWVTLWVVAVAWVFFQASRFGDDTARSGMGSYFLSTGMSRVSQMLQIWAACMSYLIPLVGAALAVCFVGAMPSGSEERGMWIVTNFQYAALFLLVIAPLTMLAISVGSRFGSTIGYVIPLCLSVYGLFGVGYLAMMINVRENIFLDWLYVLSPHYHLADLTPRLVFKQGSMVGSEFLQLVAYFLGLKLVLSMISTVCFQTKPAT